ncbi:MAG: glycosyltransferase family 4 protein [Bacteroidota bacterium]|nr:glycosyltransferase family 4 protein [Bacteroidota bacterium]
MNYLLLLAALFGAILIYFKIADKFNIIDKPNERSSHSDITLRGGGVIFWVAGAIYSCFHIQESGWFLTGFTLISLISFVDDIQNLHSRVRFAIHMTAVSLAFYGIGLFEILNIWQITLAYFFVVGVINAYNFMDGINGITGLYSLSILLALAFINNKIVAFTESDFIWYPVCASLVFLFFNYRKHAKCFAGDVGSVSIAFWIIMLLLQLVMKTGNPAWLLLLTVYGVDAAGTVIHRVYLKQNIFQPHRLHFYQILANEQKIDHRTVSFTYALLQGIVSLVVILFYNRLPAIALYTLVVLPFVAIYPLKLRLMAPTK